MTRLSEQERQRLRALHKIERDRRICDRIKAVLMHDSGWSIPQIAEALLLSSDAIRAHLKEFEASQKLNPDGGGSKEKLSSDESRELEAHLAQHTYMYVKSIIALVKARWDKEYTVSGMTDWLNRHGFSNKKPKLIPCKADKEQQLSWIDKYEALKAALGEDEAVYFIDGVHPTHNAQLGYGWIRKGAEKEIPANSGRRRLNLTGGINIETHKVVFQHDKTLDAQATISFLKRLEAAEPDKQKIYVFCDNAGYYRNKQVKAYIEQSRINLQFLPPYSPNLNPIERLWKWMKETVTYNTFYEDFSGFKNAVFGFLHTINRLSPDSHMGQLFRRRIRDRFRAQGAPSWP